MNRLDKKIRIYKIDNDVDSEGNQVAIKHYLNENDKSMFNAYFRSLSTVEKMDALDKGDDSEVQFEINRREIYTGYFIEYTRPLFGLKTYRINMIDPYDDRNRSRVRIRATEVTPQYFDKIKYGGVN